MNFKAHSTFGLFTGVLVFYLTHDLIAALIVLLVQVGLILDFLFKRAIGFEPLHTFLAMIGVWLLALVVTPAYHVYVLIAYFTHLFLDIFVEEDIYLAYPFRWRLVFPVKHSEAFVSVASLVGTLIIVLILIS